MDLDRHNLRGYANLLLNSYLDLADDYQGLPALPLFLSCRAAIRAHVSVSMAQRAQTGDLDNYIDQAKRLLDMAIQYLEPSRKQLIALGGLSGTGKSTLAIAVAPLLGQAPGAIVLRSDVIRKRIWKVDLQSRLPQAAYSSTITNQVYATIAREAKRILDCGYSVIADAVFGQPTERAQIAAVADNNVCAFFSVWLDAPLAILEQRVAARQNDASDATIEVLHSQLRKVRRPNNWPMIDASMSPVSIVDKMARLLHVSQSSIT